MQQSPAVFIQQKFQTWLDEHRIIRLAGRIPPSSIRQALAVLAGFPQFDTRQCRPRFIRSLGLRVQAYELADIGPTPGGPTLGAIFFRDLIAGNQKYMSFEGVVFWTWTPLIWAWNRGVSPKRNTKRPDQRLHPFLGLDQSVALQSQTLTVQVQKTTSSKYM
ncbi:hypothetical protein B0H11DRAFT_1905280 [Mycena galericulata]|nr:hypothetical protein B0H11DRAFT_1905280 [Mycena galericulata]